MSNKPKEEAHIEAFLAQLGAAPKTLEEIARGLGCTPRNAARYLALAKEKVPDRFVEEPGRRGRPATFAAAKTAPDAGEFFNVLRGLVQELRKDSSTLGYSDQLSALIRKFDPKGDRNQSAKLARLSPYYIVDNGPLAEAPCRPAILNAIVSAIDEGKQISFDYDANGKGKTKVGSANPIRLILRVGCLYLAATLAGDVEKERSFRVAYISNVRTTGTPVPERAKEIGKRIDRRGWFVEHFGQFRKVEVPSCKVTLEIHPDPTNGEPDWLWRYAKHWRFMTESGQNSVVLREKAGEIDLKVRPTPDFVAWLAGQAPDIEVKAPESLRKEVADRVAAAAKLYGKKAR